MKIQAVVPQRDEATEFTAVLGLRGNLPTAKVEDGYEAHLTRWVEAVQAAFVPAEVIGESGAEVLRPAWAARNFPPGTRCVYCLSLTERPARDHIVPFSAGGTESYDNIVPACRTCNSKKKDRSLLAFVAAGGIS